MIWPEWSNGRLGGTSALECPRHLSKVQCTMHLMQSFNAFSTLIKVLCPWHNKKFTVQYYLMFPLSASLVTPSFFRWPDFWDRDEGVPSLPGLTDFGGNWSWASMSPLMSPVVIWAEPLSTWSHLLCTLWWCGALLESACWQLCESCTFTGVISRKGVTFHMALWSAVGRPTCCLLLLCFWIVLPPTIGPTLGGSFVSQDLMPPSGRGVASHALGLWWWTEMKAQIKML